MRILVCSLIAAATILSCRTTDPRAAPQAMPMPEDARPILQKHMVGHTEKMTILLWTILALDWNGAELVARAIATGPRLARPSGPNDPSMNRTLPAQYFELDDRLTESIRKLLQVTSAPERDPAALAGAFSELVSTCVRCHAVYLPPRPPPSQSREPSVQREVEKSRIFGSTSLR